MGEVTSPTTRLTTPLPCRLDIRKRKREERKIQKLMNELFILYVLNLLRIIK
jgi:hypothetical protein